MPRVAKKSKKAPSTRMTKQHKQVMFGGEPAITAEIDSKEYYQQVRDYQNWANVFFEVAQLKDFFLSWASKTNTNIDHIKSLPPYRFISVGKLAYLVVTDKPVSGTIEKWIDNYVTDLEEIAIREKEAALAEQNRLLEIADSKTVSKNQKDYWNISDEITKLLDNKNVKAENVQAVCTANEMNVAVSKMVYEHFNDTLKDATTELESLGKTKKANPYKTILTAFSQDLQTIVSTLKSLVTNLDNAKAAVRKPRKPRERKAKDPSVVVSNLKYKQTDKDLSLTSIAPTAIIGAKALMVFNTNTRKFGIFYASDATGLNVKGTTILNFDEKKSTSKTLRKPAEQINDLTAGTLKQGEIKLRAIKAVDILLKGRINEDVLLLKVYR